MRSISLEELLEAGCHFGHQVSRQNSKARDYIFEARDGIHIIDLEKTKEGLEDAAKFVKDVAKRDGSLLVVGTKRQAQGLLREELKRVEGQDLYFVTKRWIGGTLTNFSEVAKNFKKLKDITARLKDDRERAGYTKKELGDWEKERQKLEAFYGGVADMPKIPDAIFVIDTHIEHVVAEEALKSNVPTVGITDTNADPTIITYPIPANDDAVGSLKLIISYIFDAWIEGKKSVGQEEAVEKKVEKAAAPAKSSGELKEEKSKDAASDAPVKKEKKEAPKKEAKPAAKKTAAKKPTVKKEKIV
jgi:small subunit ribosomal protein S2